MKKRVESLEFKRFIKEGDYIKRDKNRVYKAISAGVGAYVVVCLPKLALASNEVVEVVASGGSCGQSAGFWELENKVLLLFDTGIVIALMISGGAWMFGGERGKVIERIIMACSGYILARHSTDIMCWLKQF